MEKLLFLDDYRQPIDCASYMYRKGVDCKIYHKEWNIVRKYDEFVSWVITNGLPDFISFDHDLSEVHIKKSTYKEKTGMDCAKWLVNYCLDNNLSIPQFAVHSANPSGGANIEGLLKNFKEKVK